ncbi:hypothetical protein, partial [Chryseobacterium sp. CH1]|uniref:hypothetical protein n=1 Tax=Chryseobacterium sp. CH1 TaxID=713551 RepID=UPI00102580DE
MTKACCIKDIQSNLTLQKQEQDFTSHELVWWLLKQLYDKSLLYKGYTIQPYSPKAGTGLYF